MERYFTEVVPSHKGAGHRGNRIRRSFRDEAFVDKKLAALVTEDLQGLGSHPPIRSEVFGKLSNRCPDAIITTKVGVLLSSERLLLIIPL